MARRAEITPAQVGLPDGGPRRTPGLRREEVALLAGVGVSWYTWIEQGRAANVSGEVLDAIARALQLDDTQRLYLRRLIGANADHPIPESVPDKELLQPFVDNWMPGPAYIADRYWNVVVSNRTADALLDIKGGSRNIIRNFFTCEGVRERHPQWELDAQRIVARFRSQAARYAADPHFGEMVAGLRREGDGFGDLWDRCEVVEDSCGTDTFLHPDVGHLSFERATLDFTNRIALRMTVYLPDPGTGTKEAIEKLAALATRSHLEVAEKTA